MERAAFPTLIIVAIIMVVWLIASTIQNDRAFEECSAYRRLTKGSARVINRDCFINKDGVIYRLDDYRKTHQGKL